MVTSSNIGNVMDSSDKRIGYSLCPRRFPARCLDYLQTEDAPQVGQPVMLNEACHRKIESSLRAAMSVFVDFFVQLYRVPT